MGTARCRRARVSVTAVSAHRAPRSPVLSTRPRFRPTLRRSEYNSAAASGARVPQPRARQGNVNPVCTSGFRAVEQAYDLAVRQHHALVRSGLMTQGCSVPQHTPRVGGRAPAQQSARAGRRPRTRRPRGSTRR